jgi:hypothetical protein
MAKINGLDVEKISLINQIGMKWEKAVMAMDAEAFNVFKAMWKDEVKIPTSFGPESYNGKNSIGLRCPYYKS